MGTTGYFLSDGTTDLDSVFEPGTASPQSAYPRKDNGKALAYAPLSEGTAVTATEYFTSGGVDFNTLWAKKGSVAYLQDPPTWPSSNFRTAPPSSNGIISPPSGLIMPSVSSVHSTDHLSIFVKIVFYSNGEWWAWMTATNHWDDSWYYYNNVLNTDLTQYNSGAGNFTTSFQVGAEGSGFAIQPVPAQQMSGNWLSTPATGAGSNYLLTASFSPVYDYTTTASSLTGGTYTYAQGLKGATSGMNIACNGGFVILGGNESTGGTVQSSATNVSMGQEISVCYGWNSSGGFGGNFSGLHGPDGVLRWVLYTLATIKISNVAGTASVTGSVGLGADINWDDYSSGYVPPNNYVSSNVDTAPYTSVNVGAGSQGQWNYGGSSGGGGGGGGCVVLNAEMFDGDVAANYHLDRRVLVTDPYAAEGTPSTFYGDVEFAEPVLVPCVQVRTQSGAILQMSATAPIPTRDGGFVLAPQLKGHTVPIAKRDQFDAYREGELPASPSDVAWQWDEVVEVDDIGLQWVQHLTVAHHHHCFWASSNGAWFILHHNLKPIAGTGTQAQ